jgi:cytochrome c biogenesis protein CcdA
MKKLLILISIVVLLVGVVLLLRSDFGTKLLWDISKEGKLLLPLVVVASLIDSINPCAFSVLILTIAFLVTLGSLRANILKIGLSYILGIFVAYFLIGLGILQAFHLFNVPGFMGKVGAGLLILLGVVGLINAIFPKLSLRVRLPHGVHKLMALYLEKGSVVPMFFLGGLVGLCEFPCTGGAYLVVLGLLYDAATYYKGLAYLVLYNAIFVLPLVILLLVAGNKLLLERIQKWQSEGQKIAKWGIPLATITLGIIIFLL